MRHMPARDPYYPFDAEVPFSGSRPGSSCS